MSAKIVERFGIPVSNSFEIFDFSFKLVNYSLDY